MAHVHGFLSGELGLFENLQHRQITNGFIFTNTLFSLENK